MSTNAEIHARRLAALPTGWGSLLPIYIERAANAELWDVEGKRLIDFAGGIAVLNTGHLHPKVKAAVAAQLEGFTHTCFMVTPYEPLVTLAERLNALVPGPTEKRTFFANSGAEAVENAVKIARYATKRNGVIAFAGGFHGRTHLTMALTGKVMPYKHGFGPFPTDIYHAPYPYEYRGVTPEHSLEAINRLFKEDIEPERVAAILIEPVLGEGGFVVAPPAFLAQLRELCDQYGIVLIIDEIQTGFARTGKMFAHEYAGIEADLVTLAKSLGGGLPLSAVTGKASIMNTVHPSGVGGTFGGSPLSCAAALAVIDVIEEENLVDRSNALGELFVKRLEGMASYLDPIGDVRGLGAMVAMELVSDRKTKEPDPDLTKRLVAACAEAGLLILSCGTYGNVVRCLAPLTAPDDIVNEGLDIVEESLRKLTA
ncbi:MAG TPA: 4-aminobutyrate--2-oxoglutarate transaminase [Acidimicrobiia bacterium]|nr:4-aminobutyrate--2-oxoglutarate transaminase [Acidimicrobiia bacterium]